MSDTNLNDIFLEVGEKLVSRSTDQTNAETPTLTDLRDVNIKCDSLILVNVKIYTSTDSNIIHTGKSKSFVGVGVRDLRGKFTHCNDSPVQPPMVQKATFGHSSRA